MFLGTATARSRARYLSRKEIETHWLSVAGISTATASSTWPSRTSRYDIWVMLGNGDGTFQAPMTFTVGHWPSALVAGDFNGDGQLDLAVADFQDRRRLGAARRRRRDVLRSRPSRQRPQATPLVADVNGDGTRCPGRRRRRRHPVPPGNPRAARHFRAARHVNPGSPRATSPGSRTTERSAAGQRRRPGRRRLALRLHDGGFVASVRWPTGQLPAQIIAADLNDDGWDDLVVRNAGDGTLSVSSTRATRQLRTGSTGRSSRR